ncbi:phage/plasmid primase, P4 family [Clostridium sp. YIM B02551]|uniref:DNA primase family protein n=1 Tax=Clostridium sp. YIM B02551 TaxID=2910679 RepID=UPI001EEC0823|nr:phage/plasmid primase, P4 family [Clostridium sp. YIM B02551]
MFSDEHLEKARKMGMILNKQTGEVEYFSANKFAEYVSKTSYLKYHKQEFIKYEFGKWTEVDEMRVFKRLREVLHRYNDDIWNTKLEKEYVEALKRTVLINIELNSYKRYINMLNGMYDLEEHILVQHNPEFYSSIQIPIPYDENAECPMFMKFLDDCFQGDEESKILAQEWAGYLLTAETKAQKALILYGEGANGKGVFIDIMSYLIGQENISSIPLNELHKGFSRVCLYNKLANISNENECNGNSFNTQYFKAITGEDVITAEQKNKPVFEFKPTVKLVFSTNNLPHTKDTSYGFMRRLSILHFRNTVKEENRDRDLKEKLKLEAQGIFRWAVEGLKRLRENNFKFSECTTSNEVIKQYEKDLNPMVLFFEECIRKAKVDHREDRRIIYNSFRVWAEANGMEGYAKISTQRFWKKFQEQAKALNYNCTLGRSNTFRYCTNVKVVGEYRVTPDNPILNAKYVVKPPLGG